MKTEFRRAVLPAELRSLVTFDHKVFRGYPADWFDREAWQTYETWWMIVNNRKAGCCAFERHVDFLEDLGGGNPTRHGSLYISTTGILPELQGMGLGKLFKCWQIAYARHHGFMRIVTNHRKSNRRIIALNKAFGFRIIRTTANYYEEPHEPTLVMELQLGSE